MSGKLSEAELVQRLIERSLPPALPLRPWGAICRLTVSPDGTLEHTEILPSEMACPAGIEPAASGSGTNVAGRALATRYVEGPSWPS